MQKWLDKGVDPEVEFYIILEQIFKISWIHPWTFSPNKQQVQLYIINRCIPEEKPLKRNYTSCEFPSIAWRKKQGSWIRNNEVLPV